MPDLNRSDVQIVLKKGLDANLEKVDTAALGIQGESAYTTDNKQLFIHDGAIYQPVQTVDMLVVHKGSFVFNDQEPVIKF